MRNTLLLLLASCLMVGAANAADKPAASPWKRSAELGLIRTTGNTQTQTLAAKADVVYEVEKWRHTGHAEAFGQQTTDKGTGETVNSAERYELSGKSDYKFSKLDYIFGLADLKRDRFSGFDYEYAFSAGYGRTLLKRTNMQLDVEIGPGIRFFKEDKGTADNEAILRLAGKYWWAITDNSKFTQNLSVDIGEQFTTTKSVSGLQANISNMLALKLTYTLLNKSNVPTGTESTDTELATTLVYSF